MVKLKTKEDIEILKEGGGKHAAILRELAGRVHPGVSTLELEGEALRLCREMGVRPAHLNYTPAGATRPFPAALCISINDEIVHGIPNENVRPVNDGDIVSIDLSIEYKGMITDSAITVACGVVDDESKKLLRVAIEALDAGIAAAKPGNHIGDIGAAISKVVKEGGFYIADDLAGHGVGFAIHEEPFVPNFGRAGEGEELIPGMVIAIEPMVNIGTSKIKFENDDYTIKTRDGSRSAHFEHTVAITDKGHIILTL